MDLDTLIAQWSAKAPAGLRAAGRQAREGATVQAQALQRRPAAVKKDGTFAHACAEMPRPPGCFLSQQEAAGKP